MVYDPNDPSLSGSDYYNFHQSTNETGNFNITTFSFFQSLRDAKPSVESVLFDEFKLVRFDLAKELAQGNNNSLGLQTVNTTSGSISYIDGYSINQQDVLIGAFYQTYTAIRN